MSYDQDERTRPPPLGLEERRDRTIEALSRHFAADRLTIEEYERRVDLALEGRNDAQLDALVRDLDPPASGSAVSSARSAPATPATSAPLARPATPPGADAGAEPDGDRQYVFAVMGGNTRKGGWQPARRIFSYAFWGGAELDFREAVLPEGTIEVTAIAVMGGVEIVVPPGVGIEAGGFALMGGVDQELEPAAGPESDASAEESSGGRPRTRIVVKGFALMGGVSVQVRRPGESARDARRRRKLRGEQDRRRLRGG